MDKLTQSLFMQLLDCGSDEIPLGVRTMHARFLEIWKRTGQHKHNIPIDTLILICLLGADEDIRAGHPVVVEGKRGKFVSKWKDGTVRVKFPGDDKQFRVVKADEVHYE